MRSGIPGSGFPVINYNDDTNNDLKMAVCHDAACSNPSLIIVDSVGKLTSGTLALNRIVREG